MKTIKLIDTFRYKVELARLQDDSYIINYRSKIVGLENKSETIKDYNIASFLFDLKVEELEGQ